jgi:hypothetical protein
MPRSRKINREKEQASLVRRAPSVEESRDRTRGTAGAYSLLRRNQIHQTRSWYEKNRIFDAFNRGLPGLIGIELADQWRRLDPKAIVLDESHDARINHRVIEQPENYRLISQVGFVNH